MGVGRSGFWFLVGVAIARRFLLFVRGGGGGGEERKDGGEDEKEVGWRRTVRARQVCVLSKRLVALTKRSRGRWEEGAIENGIKMHNGFSRYRETIQRKFRLNYRLGL